jgi:Ulp1 family protease
MRYAQRHKVSDNVDIFEVSSCDPEIRIESVCVFPPSVDGKRQIDSVVILASAIFRLEEGEHLNDSLLDFYMQYLQKMQCNYKL